MRLVRRLAVLLLLIVCLAPVARAEWNECHEWMSTRYYECLESCEVYPSHWFAYRYCRTQCTDTYYDELEACDNP